MAAYAFEVLRPVIGIAEPLELEYPLVRALRLAQHAPKREVDRLPLRAKPVQLHDPLDQLVVDDHVRSTHRASLLVSRYTRMCINSRPRPPRARRARAPTPARRGSAPLRRAAPRARGGRGRRRRP